MLQKREIYKNLKYALINDLYCLGTDDSGFESLLGAVRGKAESEKIEFKRYILPLHGYFCPRNNGVHHLLRLFSCPFGETFGEEYAQSKSFLIVIPDVLVEAIFAYKKTPLPDEFEKIVKPYKVHLLLLNTAGLPAFKLSQPTPRHQDLIHLADAYEGPLEGLAHELHFFETHYVVTSADEFYPDVDRFHDPHGMQESEYELLCSFQSIGEILNQIETRLDLNFSSGRRIMQDFFPHGTSVSERGYLYFRLWLQKCVTRARAKAQLENFCSLFEHFLVRDKESGRIDIGFIQEVARRKFYN